MELTAEWGKTGFKQVITNAYKSQVQDALRIYLLKRDVDKVLKTVK